MLKITDGIITTVDRNEITIPLLLGNCKVSDTIDRGYLLTIIHLIGFSNNTIGLTGNYLTSKNQQVQLKGNLSNLQRIVREYLTDVS